MRPEMPYLAAGAVAVVGGAVKEKAFPANGVLAITATIFLVIITSMTTGTKIAPLVHAIGMLLLMGSIFATVTAASKTAITVAPTNKAVSTTAFNGPTGGGNGGGGGGSW